MSRATSPSQPTRATEELRRSTCARQNHAAVRSVNSHADAIGSRKRGRAGRMVRCTGRRAVAARGVRPPTLHARGHGPRRRSFRPRGRTNARTSQAIRETTRGCKYANPRRDRTSVEGSQRTRVPTWGQPGGWGGNGIGATSSTRAVRDPRRQPRLHRQAERATPHGGVGPARISSWGTPSGRATKTPRSKTCIGGMISRPDGRTIARRSRRCCSPPGP